MATEATAAAAEMKSVGGAKIAKAALAAATVTVDARAGPVS